MKLLIKALIVVCVILFYIPLAIFLEQVGLKSEKSSGRLILDFLLIFALFLCRKSDFWYTKYRMKKLMKEMPQLEGETKEDYKARLMQELKRQGVMPEKKKKEGKK